MYLDLCVNCFCFDDIIIKQGSGRAADMLAFAYNNTLEEEVKTFDANGKNVMEKVPRIPDEIKAKLYEKVETEWPTKDVSATAGQSSKLTIYLMYNLD